MWYSVKIKPVVSIRKPWYESESSVRQTIASTVVGKPWHQQWQANYCFNNGWQTITLTASSKWYWLNIDRQPPLTLAAKILIQNSIDSHSRSRNLNLLQQWQRSGQSYTRSTNHSQLPGKSYQCNNRHIYRASLK